MAALTAAAQVGDIETAENQLIDAEFAAHEQGYRAAEAATIERCAQVADRYAKHPVANEIAADIRAHGWNRETVETRCVLARENRGRFLAVYIAKVRITVNANGSTTIHEGHGTDEGRGISPGEVHDIAYNSVENMIGVP